MSPYFWMERERHGKSSLNLSLPSSNITQSSLNPLHSLRRERKSTFNLLNLTVDLCSVSNIVSDQGVNMISSWGHYFEEIIFPITEKNVLMLEKTLQCQVKWFWTTASANEKKNMLLEWKVNLRNRVHCWNAGMAQPLRWLVPSNETGFQWSSSNVWVALSKFPCIELESNTALLLNPYQKARKLHICD